MIISEVNKVNGERKEVIPPDDVEVESIDMQENIYRKYEQSNVDNSPLVHPRMTTKEGGQLISTCGEGQGKYIQGKSKEELVVII